MSLIMKWINENKNSKSANEYQKWTNSTAVYDVMIDKMLWGDETEEAIKCLYLSNTINEEAGELAGKTKRLIRDNEGVLNEELAQGMLGELGDILYYVAQYAQAIGYELQEVIDYNVAKLEDRKERNAIHGSGDKR
jgi:NTP pyrophosphatase (non-canonical NTP hydrolase)